MEVSDFARSKIQVNIDDLQAERDAIANLLN